MFWREQEKQDKELNCGPPCGQLRVLIVGDSGVGKTSLVHLIVKGSSIASPPQTFGCTVGVKHTTYGSSGSSSNSIKGDSERDFFVELWDISGHEQYKDCRSLFYSQINGVIFVHDLSQRRTKTSLHKWASDIAATGTFSAPLGSGGPGGLPVPYIVIGNKADIAAKEGIRGSSGNLVDAARQWVEKQGLLPSSEELPLTESFPGSGGLIVAAKEARYDKEAVMKFFRMLIRRRYFSDELLAANPWSTPVQRPVQRSSESLSDEDQLYKSTRIYASLIGSYCITLIGSVIRIGELLMCSRWYMTIMFNRRPIKIQSATHKNTTFSLLFRLNAISHHLRRFILNSQCRHPITTTAFQDLPCPGHRRSAVPD